MVGALRCPTRPWIPIEVDLPSVNARAGSWQVLQATVRSADSRPSKNSFWPRAIFSGVCGLSGGIADRVASVGAPTCLGDLGWASGPAWGMGGGFRVVDPRVSGMVPAAITTRVVTKRVLAKSKERTCRRIRVPVLMTRRLERSLRRRPLAEGAWMQREPYGLENRSVGHTRGTRVIGRLAKQKITKELAHLLGPRWHEVISAFHSMIEVLEPIVTTFCPSNHALLDGLILAQVRLVADEQDARLEGRPEGIRPAVDFHIAAAQFHVAFLLVACGRGIGILCAVDLATPHGVLLCPEGELVPGSDVLADLAERHVRPVSEERVGVADEHHTRPKIGRA